MFSGSQGICSAVEVALKLTQKHMELLGGRARQDYEHDRHAFVERMEEVRNLLEQRLRQGLA